MGGVVHFGIANPKIVTRLIVCDTDTNRCTPRLMCSKFEVPKKKHNCDFYVSQLDPMDNDHEEKSLCSGLFFQGQCFWKPRC